MTVKDVVCGMTIEEKDAGGRSVYKGRTYYFCSKACKMEFDDNPSKYVKG
jgi:Cu+-exporting ATPase